MGPYEQFDDHSEAKALHPTSDFAEKTSDLWSLWGEQVRLVEGSIVNGRHSRYGENASWLRVWFNSWPVPWNAELAQPHGHHVNFHIQRTATSA